MLRCCKTGSQHRRNVDACCLRMCDSKCSNIIERCSTLQGQYQPIRPYAHVHTGAQYTFIMTFLMLPMCSRTFFLFVRLS